jgi:large subunit ribosomal protein L25
MTERLRVDIPLRLVGEAPAIRTTGGTLFQSLSTVSIESLPGDLPDAIEVDVSNLVDLDSAVHVRDLSIPDAVTLLTDVEELVVRVLPPTVEPEATEEAAEGEAAAEATAEGEPAAAAEESSEES